MICFEWFSLSYYLGIFSLLFSFSTIKMPPSSFSPCLPSNHVPSVLLSFSHSTLTLGSSVGIVMFGCPAHSFSLILCFT